MKQGELTQRDIYELQAKLYEKFEQFDDRMDARFATLERKLEQRVDCVQEECDKRRTWMDDVSSAVQELKHNQRIMLWVGGAIATASLSALAMILFEYFFQIFGGV